MDDLLGISGMQGPPGSAPADDFSRYGVVVHDGDDFERVYADLPESLVALVRDQTGHGNAAENPLHELLISGLDLSDRRTDEPTRLSGTIQFFLRLLDDWRLSKRDAVGLLGFNPEDGEYVAQLLDGRQKLRGRDIIPFQKSFDPFSGAMFKG